MKNVPNDWINQICDNIMKRVDNFYDLTTDQLKDGILDDIQMYLNMPFNLDYYISEKAFDKFKSFFISIVTHQCMTNFHPLTCGIGGGSHTILVPRIQGDICMLVCPTCGWIQFNPPIMF